MTNAEESPVWAYLELSAAMLEFLPEIELKEDEVGGRCSF